VTLRQLMTDLPGLTGAPVFLGEVCVGTVKAVEGNLVGHGGRLQVARLTLDPPAAAEPDAAHVAGPAATPA
jgi:hypothetical protein